MNDDETLRGAIDAPVMAVADRIQGLEHQLARLTQMVQTVVKQETVGIEERQSVKDALGGLNGGHIVRDCTPRTIVETAGSAPRIHATQETDQQADRASYRSEELWAVSQRMTGSAFATAAVSTSASGIHNFSLQIKVLVDAGNLLLMGLCVSESFFLSLGGKLRDLLPPSFQTANRASENSAMHTCKNPQWGISNFITTAN